MVQRVVVHSNMPLEWEIQAFLAEPKAVKCAKPKCFEGVAKTRISSWLPMLNPAVVSSGYCN